MPRFVPVNTIQNQHYNLCVCHKTWHLLISWSPGNISDKIIIDWYLRIRSEFSGGNTNIKMFHYKIYKKLENVMHEDIHKVQNNVSLFYLFIHQYCLWIFLMSSNERHLWFSCLQLLARQKVNRHKNFHYFWEQWESESILGNWYITKFFVSAVNRLQYSSTSVYNSFSSLG